MTVSPAQHGTRRLVLVAAGLLVVLVVVSGAVFVRSNDPPHRVAPPRPPLLQRGSITRFLTEPGDQVVVVPRGRYRGGEITAPHPATAGPYEGWLVLVAERRNEVVIDLSDGPLTLLAGTSRVMFVGFRFTHGRLYNYGEDIRYWYTDHTYPDYDWYKRNPTTANIPRFFYLSYGSRRVSLYGADFRDGTASAVNVASGAGDILIQGARFVDVYERRGSDPEDLSHANLISILAGNVHGFEVRDTYMEHSRNNHQARDGDISGLVYENVWFTKAAGSAFQFHSMNGYRIHTSRRVNVHSWAHRGREPRDRWDQVEGAPVEKGSRPDLIDVKDVSIRTRAPRGANPAVAWRADHPYASWAHFFEWDRGGTTPGVGR